MQFYFDSDVPIYLQVAEQIEDGILSGAFCEEEQIPSTTEISVAYKINPATVLKGVNLLADEGILYKKRGIGMFVSQGAQTHIRKKRHEAFYVTYVVKLLEEAEKLNIDKNEIVDMILRGGRYD
jgi:DNA-binding transcriptional regulator YhcF (GntR family)